MPLKGISFKKLVRRIFSHSITYAIGPQLPKVAGFLLLPLFTKYLTDVDFGIWGTISAYSLFLYAVRDLGLLVPLLNSYVNHQYHWRWRWTNVFNFLFVWGFIYSAVLGLVLYFIIPVEALDNRGLIIGLYVFQSLICDIIIVYGIRYYQLKESPLYVSFVSIVSGFSAIFVQYIFIVKLQQGFMGWVFGNFCTILLSGILYLPAFISKIYIPYFKIRMKYIYHSLKVGLPLIPHNYSSYLLNTSDRMVMNWFQVDTKKIGFYSAAYLWGNYLEILGTAVGMAIGPIYLKIFAKKGSDSVIYSLTQFLQYSFLLGCFILGLWMKELFQLIINTKGIQSAYGLAVIIVMSYSYRPLYWHVVNRLQFEEKTKSLWKISFVAGMLNLILNIILIPIFDFKVAAYTTFFSLLFLGFAGFHLKDFKRVDTGSHMLIFHFLLIIFCTAIAYLLVDVAVEFKVILTILSVSIYGLVVRPLIKELNLA